MKIVRKKRHQVESSRGSGLTNNASSAIKRTFVAIKTFVRVLVHVYALNFRLKASKKAALRTLAGIRF